MLINSFERDQYITHGNPNIIKVRFEGVHANSGFWRAEAEKEFYVHKDLKFEQFIEEYYKARGGQMRTEYFWHYYDKHGEQVKTRAYLLRDQDYLSKSFEQNGFKDGYVFKCT